MAPWNPNIPLSTDVPANSQSQLLQDFQSLDTWISVNHVNPSAGGDQGKHKFVSFPVQAITPTFSAGEQGLYNKLYATTTINELYVHKQAATAGTAEVPFTAGTLSQTVAPVSGAPTWNWTPSGFMEKSGRSTGVSGLVTITPAGGPNFTQILDVQVTPLNAATSISFSVWLYDINAANTFRVYVNGTGGFTWRCKGY